MPNSFSRRQIIKAAGGFVAGTASVGVVNHLTNGSSIIKPAQAQTILGRANIGSGYYRLYCNGSFYNRNHRLLDGRTSDGTVGLAPDSRPYLSGTRWYIRNFNGGSYYTLLCAGDQPNPKHRYLDGRTLDASVGLAPNYGGIYSGTIWHIWVLNIEALAFECQGAVEGRGRSWLDGNTYSGGVALAPDYFDTHSGTHWQALETSSPD